MPYSLEKKKQGKWEISVYLFTLVMMQNCTYSLHTWNIDCTEVSHLFIRHKPYTVPGNLQKDVNSWAALNPSTKLFDYGRRKNRFGE